MASRVSDRHRHRLARATQGSKLETKDTMKNTAPTRTEADDNDQPAEYTSGAQWADELDVDPETPIASELGADAWKAVRKFHRQHELETVYFGDDGMSFADLPVVPMSICNNASPSIKVTRREVAEFAEDTMTDDPHEIGARLKRERAKRFRVRDQIALALKPQRIPAHRQFTLEAVRTVLGIEIAEAARGLIDRANRRAWSTPKPHSHCEREYLITAGELFSRLGVLGADIARLAPATEADRDAALSELAIARIRHRDDATRRARAGDTPALDLDAEALSVSEWRRWNR